MSENLHRSIANRAVTALLALPTPILHRITGVHGPVIRDGRVLHPALAALLVLAEKQGIDRSLDAVSPSGRVVPVRGGRHARPDRRAGRRPARRPRRGRTAGTDLPTFRDHRDVAGRRLLPRRGLGHRRPGHPRQQLPPAGRGGPVRGRGRGLPTGARRSLPGCGGRRHRRISLGLPTCDRTRASMRPGSG